MAAAPASRFLYGGSRQWIMISRRSWRRSGSGWRICLSTKGAKWDAAPMGTSTRRGGKMGKSAGGGVGSSGPRRWETRRAGWVGAHGARWRGSRSGVPGASRRHSCCRPPLAGRAPPSRSAQPRRGASVPPRVAAACLQRATTWWRPRLEVEFGGLVPGDSERSGRAWLKSYRYGPVLVTVVEELPNRRSAFPGRRFESSRGRRPCGGSALRVLAGPWGLTLDAANPVCIPDCSPAPDSTC